MTENVLNPGDLESTAYAVGSMAQRPQQPTTSLTARLAGSPLLRSIAAAAVAFVFYAVWAAFANRMHDDAMILTAALTQGIYSAAVTFTMTSIVELLFRGKGTRRMRLTRCIAVTIVLLVASSVGVHWLAGTAELLATVLPSWIFGSAYAVVYALGLARADAARTARFGDTA